AQAAITELAAEEDPYVPPTVSPGAARDAYSADDLEALIAEGNDAVGQVVRTDLFCGPISSIAVRDVEEGHEALKALTSADGRIAAAECRWSREAGSSDLTLVVPPALVEAFTGAPEEELNFVRRRRIPAQLEWLGR